MNKKIEELSADWEILNKGKDILHSELVEMKNILCFELQNKP